jgi:transposase, IS30 family
MRKSERMEIWILLKKKYSLRNIAEAMGRNVSTISREIQRNSVKGEYSPVKAQQKAEFRWRYRKTYMKKIRGHNVLEKYIREKIQEGWSPETIAQRWNTIEKGEEDPCISHTSIYEYIDSHFGYGLEKYLYSCRGNQNRRKKKGNSKKGVKEMVLGRTWIHERPEHINTRKSVGDAEADTICSRKGDKTSFITLIDRKTRFLMAAKVKNKCPKRFTATIQRKIKEKKFPLSSLTLDSGIECKNHKNLPCPTYFCHPYCSHEKGQIEYGNRLIRRYIPKKTLLKTISPFFLSKIIRKINNTPRKCLNWKTPQEVLNLELQKAPP